MIPLRTLTALITQDLRHRWSGGVLTWAWALIQPSVQIALYAIVFGAIMVPRGVTFPSSGAYVIYLCSGVFCWLGFSEALARGSTSLLEGTSLIRGRGIAPFLFPLRAVGTAWILALIGFIGTLVIAPLAGVEPSWAWLLLPLPVLSLIILAAGLALLVAPVTVLARDTVQVVHLLLPLLFWATPIVYEPAILPTWAQDVQRFNPLAPAIKTIHGLALRGECPGLFDWIALAVVPLSALGMGWWTIRRLDSEVRDAL